MDELLIIWRKHCIKKGKIRDMGGKMLASNAECSLKGAAGIEKRCRFLI